MANFFISGSSSTARTLNGSEEGIVGIGATLYSDNADVITLRGEANDVTVLGAVVAAAGFEAIEVAGITNGATSVTVGSEGNLVASGGEAIRVADGDSTMTVRNAGAIISESEAVLYDGVDAAEGSGFLRLENTGTITSNLGAVSAQDAFGAGIVNGVGASITSSTRSGLNLELDGTAYVTNAGLIAGNSFNDAITIRAVTTSRDVSMRIQNTGEVTSAEATGMDLDQVQRLDLVNSGTIQGRTFALSVAGADTANAPAAIANSGSIVATSGSAIFVSNTDVAITNAGEIVSARGSGINLSTGDEVTRSTIDNTGVIGGRAGGDAITVSGDGPVTVQNAGVISGRVDLGDGDDEYLGQAALTAVTVNGGDGNDTLEGSGADDRFNGGANFDTLRGFGGDDRLDGGANNDLMEGGQGNDIYIVAASGDRTVEEAGAGIDRVITFIDWDLADNIEVLQASGGGDQRLSGNAMDNVIIGNDGDNVIDGGAGSDTLRGGGGDDVFVFDDGYGVDVDRIEGFVVADDKVQLDDAVFTDLIVDGAGFVINYSFIKGASAANGNDRIIYNDETGEVFYDADGTGAFEQELIAVMDAGLQLSKWDFEVV